MHTLVNKMLFMGLEMDVPYFSFQKRRWMTLRKFTIGKGVNHICVSPSVVYTCNKTISSEKPIHFVSILN